MPLPVAFRSHVCRSRSRDISSPQVRLPSAYPARVPLQADPTFRHSETHRSHIPRCSSPFSRLTHIALAETDLAERTPVGSGRTVGKNRRLRTAIDGQIFRTLQFDNRAIFFEDLTIEFIDILERQILVEVSDNRHE